MSMKRRPDSDLNHDNWNEEDEPEVVGSFEKATDEEMKSRVIRTAKRRIRTEDAADGEPPKSNIFDGFTGFGKTTPGASTTAPLFSFGKKPDEPAAAATYLPVTFGSFGSASKPESVKPSSVNSVEKSAKFCSNLKDLNEAFSKHIQAEVSGGKLGILTPALKDYIKFVEELEAGESKVAEVKAPSTFAPSTSVTPSSSTASSTTDSLTQPKPFSFGFGSTTTPSAPSFSFGTKPGGVSAPAASASSDNNAENKDDDDEDTPPKVEFTPVVEQDSLFDIRCKVFVKKDNEYASRGTGSLYLKSAPNDKVQLLVRADTNLGNILVNFLLSAAIPAKRLGKNNVMMVCIPTPEPDVKAVPILLRVKDEAEADKLLAEITKHSK